ncbi:MAG: 2Fe-2S iron-sulfur cluster binding domain-containing protein [Pseudomonadota bacterium]
MTTGPFSAVDKPASTTARVEAVINGTEHSFTVEPDALSILDAALDAGIDAPFSCRSGNCGTCVVRVLSGRAEMQLNTVLDEDDITRGLLLSCQALPRTPLLLLSWDDLER